MVRLIRRPEFCRTDLLDLDDSSLHQIIIKDISGLLSELEVLAFQSTLCPSILGLIFAIFTSWQQEAQRSFQTRTLYVRYLIWASAIW